ncbi:hypothetical protein GF324_12245, partial [bacterium]|nr:hypothetical protein [bacterium]
MIPLLIGEAWAMLDIFEKVFWYIAIPASVLGILSVLLTLLGGDIGADVEADALDGGLGYFSFKSIIMFFAAFGWVGIIAARAGLPRFWVVVLALLAGVIAGLLFALMFRAMRNLSENANITSLESTIGEYGKVYLPIPAERGGIGK